MDDSDDIGFHPTPHVRLASPQSLLTPLPGSDHRTDEETDQHKDEESDEILGRLDDHHASRMDQKILTRDGGQANIKEGWSHTTVPDNYDHGAEEEQENTAVEERLEQNSEQQSEEHRCNREPITYQGN